MRNVCECWTRVRSSSHHEPVLRHAGGHQNRMTAPLGRMPFGEWMLAASKVPMAHVTHDCNTGMSAEHVSLSRYSPIDTYPRMQDSSDMGASLRCWCVGSLTHRSLGGDVQRATGTLKGWHDGTRLMQSMPSRDIRPSRPASRCQPPSETT